MSCLFYGGPLVVAMQRRICKRLRSPGIDSQESTAYVAWELIPGLLKRFTKTDSDADSSSGHNWHLE
jgi:hypothetical protein